MIHFFLEIGALYFLTHVWMAADCVCIYLFSILYISVYRYTYIYYIHTYIYIYINAKFAHDTNTHTPSVKYAHTQNIRLKRRVEPDNDPDGL